MASRPTHPVVLPPGGTTHLQVAYPLPEKYIVVLICPPGEDLTRDALHNIVRPQPSGQPSGDPASFSFYSKPPTYYSATASPDVPYANCTKVVTILNEAEFKRVEEFCKRHIQPETLSELQPYSPFLIRNGYQANGELNPDPLFIEYFINETISEVVIADVLTWLEIPPPAATHSNIDHLLVGSTLGFEAPTAVDHPGAFLPLIDAQTNGQAMEIELPSPEESIVSPDVSANPTIMPAQTDQESFSAASMSMSGIASPYFESPLLPYLGVEYLDPPPEYLVLPTFYPPHGLEMSVCYTPQYIESLIAVRGQPMVSGTPHMYPLNDTSVFQGEMMPVSQVPPAGQMSPAQNATISVTNPDVRTPNMVQVSLAEDPDITTSQRARADLQAVLRGERPLTLREGSREPQQQAPRYPDRRRRDANTSSAGQRETTPWVDREGGEGSAGHRASRGQVSVVRNSSQSC